ncbi:hypothetical protein [Gelidibacter mesophilus]|uniref:hypothetical protein n=1 Tax=Gelidibacter mesophilus TaxID=169050 RepID=UPI000481E348|nr:hypothetical protein [Gelidibacter mesophilus]
MRDSKRFRFTKAVLFIISALYIVLMVATYFVYFKEPFIDCAKRMLGAQAIALVFQAALNYVNFRSENKIVILATMFVSTMLLYGVLSAFFNLELMCRYYGF